MGERGEWLARAARLALDVPRFAPWARTSPARVLRRQAARAPDDQALSFEDRRYSWGDVDRRASRYASWFAEQGVSAGHVVALVMGNRPDFLFALMGLNRLGVVSALINTNLSGRALVHVLRACGATKMLVGAECLEPVLAVMGELKGLSVEKDLFVKGDDGTPVPDDLSVIDEELASADGVYVDSRAAPKISETFCYICTSGTSGLPKAAIVTGLRMLFAGCVFGHLMHRSRPGDVIYVPLPLYHSSAMYLGWGAALTTGSSIALCRKFSTSTFWRDAARHRATSFLYIGELCRYLLGRRPQDGERDHQLRVGVGNGLRPEIWQEFQERFRVPIIREFYGATEGTAFTLNLSGRPGMIGRLLPIQAVVRCDLSTGEIWRNEEGRCEKVRPGEVGLLLGAILRFLPFEGYVDARATSKKIVCDVFRPGDRYFNSGDLVYLHEDRWLSFADRVGDTFRWKGENVSTNEVEDILEGVPGVVESNVYGVELPNAEGRAGMAAIRTDEDFDLRVFADHVRDNLAKYQRPLFLRLLQQEMRMTSTFKRQKVEYREEGFDLRRVEDPLYVLMEGSYHAMDRDLFSKIEGGECVPG